MKEGRHTIVNNSITDGLNNFAGQSPYEYVCSLECCLWNETILGGAYN